MSLKDYNFELFWGKMIYLEQFPWEDDRGAFSFLQAYFFSFLKFQWYDHTIQHYHEFLLHNDHDFLKKNETDKSKSKYEQSPYYFKCEQHRDEYVQ